MKSAGNSKRGAKRSLFGTRCSKRIDPHFRQLEKAEIKKASERWGFDFAADRPLEVTSPENMFSWEPVPAKKVPSFYRSKPTKSRRTKVTNSSPLKNKTTNSKLEQTSSIDAKMHKSAIKKSSLKALPMENYVVIKRSKNESPKKIKVMCGAHAYNTRSMSGMRTRSVAAERCSFFQVI